MRFVVVKSQAQQDVLALHRVRALLIRERTALMNQMRGLLAESGIVIAQGSATLRRAVAELQDNENGPTPILREILVEMSERLRLFEERLKGYDSRITGLARNDQQVARLMAVEGIGPITATALVATVGDARSPFSDASSPARIRLENQYRKSMSGAASSSTMRSVQISTSQNLGGYCLFTTLPLGSFECMIKQIIRHKCQTGRATAGNP